MELIYESGRIPKSEQIISLFKASQMPRPTDDPERIKTMFENADLVITAWDRDKLVGLCRCITDWVWCCYLADLAIDPDYKKTGIGRHLIELTREAVGEQSMILLLSVASALDYYPKVGFAKEDRGFIINRTK